eukprot:3740187-Amphidinium_carterae.2
MQCATGMRLLQLEAHGRCLNNSAHWRRRLQRGSGVAGPTRATSGVAGPLRATSPHAEGVTSH